MLEKRRRSASDRRSVPVYSRSGLTYYLQGECFRALASAQWEPARAAENLAGDVDQVKRVRGKLKGFLESAVDAMRGGGRAADKRLAALRKRFAKLPTCYGADLEQLAREFERGRFD